MFKKGFTLQELLITMAIIGVVAAITAPAIMNIVPDKNKAMYIKAYNTLTTLTDEIMGNPALYWPSGYNNAGEPEQTGMYSDLQPEIAPYNDDVNCSGVNKFPAILSHHLNLSSDVEATGNNTRNGTIIFTTSDGMLWEFNTEEIASNETIQGLAYRTTLTLDMDGEGKGDNHIYDADHTSPDQFILVIDNDGGIHPGDALGLAYLQNPTNMHATSEDKDLAEQIVNQAGSNDDWEKLSEAITEINKKNAK